MTVCVRLPALFANRIAGVNTVDVPARTVQDALRTLAARYPKLRNLVVGPTGEINPMMVVFLNDEQLSSGQLAFSVRDGDEIEIIPAIEGGLPQDAPPSPHRRPGPPITDRRPRSQARLQTAASGPGRSRPTVGHHPNRL